ncbi:MAG: cytochrome c peroxidase [Methylophagaceae bacterium]|jgi:cytochrome c peroxidase
MRYSGLKVVTLLSFGLFSSYGFAEVDQEISAADRTQQVELLAPGYGELDYDAPKPGSYKLPAFGYANDAKVLNADGEYVNYHDLFKGKYTFLSFIYLNCPDVNGCPLSHLVFNRIQNEGAKIPVVADNLQLISMSFDPENDTPEVLRELIGEDHSMHDMTGHEGHDMAAMKKDEIELTYLTADSVESLMPILDDYNQTIQNQVNDDGTQSENFSHILRVYLIDPEFNIRNIYSVSFLHPDILLNDVKTLMIEDGILEAEGGVDYVDYAHDNVGVRAGASESKEGYDQKNYETNSRAIASRMGEKSDLIRVIDTPPLGLPKVPVPANNPVTAEKIELGKKLFFDRRLSLNDTFSCAMCHIAEQGYTSNELEKAVGFEGRTNRRNAPTLYNTAYLTKLFLDGRETSLENHVWTPLVADNKMGMTSIGQVIEKVQGLPDYTGLFEAAFDGQPADIMTIAQAIASYERVLVSGNSAFDQWYYAKQEDAISDAEKRGFNLFSGKANCVACHSVGEKTALFTDNMLHNTGLGFQTAMGKEPETERMLIAPGVYIDIKASVKNSFTTRVGDVGYYEVTQDPDDRWKYRTSSLRNIALTAPYMHDGSMPDLETVIAYYNQGGYPQNENNFPNVTQSPIIEPLGLTEQESNDLVAFMKTLTGDNVEEIISDAFATPVGDTNYDN